MRNLLIICLVLCLCQNALSARILGIFPFESKSHYALGSSLMRALSEDGHDVTVISPFGEKHPPKGKYRDVVLTGLLEAREAERKNANMFEMASTISGLAAIPLITVMLGDSVKDMLEHENVQALINSGEKFDAVIIEQFFNDAHKVLAPHFGGVQIIFSLGYPNYWINPFVGNPSPVAYIPDTFLSYSDHMSFCERLSNTLAYILNSLTHNLYLYPLNKRVAEKYIPNTPDFYDTLYNVSLILTNSYSGFHSPGPLVPNIKEVLGLHIKPPKKLPADLQEYLDNAKDGVVYFSMGSNLKSALIPAEKREAILKVFSKLKQKVLWKFEDENLPGQPPNVKISSWLPQQSILAHPNVKLFITHGGLLSTTETVHYGVPVLAIPIYGDQKLNARIAETTGFGLILNYEDLNEENFGSKLNELLTNPKYNENAKLKSKLYHDRPVKPMEEALYWVNYVIRHKGAPHLRVAGVDLPWYKYFLVDVMAVLGGVALAMLLVTKCVLKAICRKICKNRKCRKQKTN